MTDRSRLDRWLADSEDLLIEEDYSTPDAMRCRPLPEVIPPTMGLLFRGLVDDDDDYFARMIQIMAEHRIAAMCRTVRPFIIGTS